MAATILGITFLVITCAAESSKVGQVEMLLVIRLCLFQNSPASFPTVPIRRAGPGGHSNNRGWNVSFLAPAAGVPSARQEGVGRSGGSHSYNYNKRCYWAFWKEVHSGESWDTQPWCDRQWHWVTWTVKSNMPSNSIFLQLLCFYKPLFSCLYFLIHHPQSRNSFSPACLILVVLPYFLISSNTCWRNFYAICMRSQILGTSYLSTYMGQNTQGRLLKAETQVCKVWGWLVAEPWLWATD